jgi:hypothetical protein
VISRHALDSHRRRLRLPCTSVPEYARKSQVLLGYLLGEK